MTNEYYSLNNIPTNDTVFKIIYQNRDYGKTYALTRYLMKNHINNIREKAEQAMKEVSNG